MIKVGANTQKNRQVANPQDTENKTFIWERERERGYVDRSKEITSKFSKLYFNFENLTCWEAFDDNHKGVTKYGFN